MEGRICKQEIRRPRVVRRTRSPVVRVHIHCRTMCSYNVLGYKPVEHAHHITSLHNTIWLFHLYTGCCYCPLDDSRACMDICTLCREFRGS